MGWRNVERPGYFSKKREELEKKWDEMYSPGKWRLAWQWGSQIIKRPEALQIYEDGYYEFLKANQDVLEWLVNTASNVYDTAQTNIEAGFSYDVQETPNNHLQDVTIRRVVLRLGRKFQGSHLVQVRGRESEGGVLTPHLVPFHLPHLIVPGEVKDYCSKGIWWRRLGIENSVEEFYQQNKVLQVIE